MLTRHDDVSPLLLCGLSLLEVEYTDNINSAQIRQLASRSEYFDNGGLEDGLSQNRRSIEE
jgi:hypothetical protein